MKDRPRSTEPEYFLPPVFDADGVQVSSGIGVDGKEYPDPVPLSPPVGYEPPSSLEMLIESVIHRRDFRKALEAGDFETAEEADDFDIDEEDDLRFPETIYERYFDAKSKRAADVAARSAREVSRTTSGDLASGSSSSTTKVETPKGEGGSVDRTSENTRSHPDGQDPNGSQSVSGTSDSKRG